LQDITHYNNFYEFSEDKQAVSVLAEKFTTHPWKVEVSGLVRHPQEFAIEDLIKKYPQEERIYRLRCVEAWSMVIPWNGFPLSKLLQEVQPTSDAKFVRFETVMRPEEMPGQKSGFFYPWPYEEGLRLDEAMHDLTILATGIYGEDLPAADGAPIRLVVPWKYGFKSIKSIVKIELVAERPATFWNNLSGYEYGFYSNVNPKRPHPRWSQASERRIGEVSRRPTLMFNGYADQVASLYDGMDLMVNY
jgi:sulfoxide reductase catalytic subunit YedY